MFFFFKFSHQSHFPARVDRAEGEVHLCSGTFCLHYQLCLLLLQIHEPRVARCFIITRTEWWVRLHSCNLKKLFKIQRKRDVRFLQVKKKCDNLKEDDGMIKIGNRTKELWKPDSECPPGMPGNPTTMAFALCNSCFRFRVVEKFDSNSYSGFTKMFIFNEFRTFKI